MKTEDRFWSKTRPSDSGCLEWTAALGKNPNGTLGYGQFSLGSRSDKTRRMHSAHRVAWMLKNGPVPDGLNVLHRCDNQKCVNPEHLFLGTQLDNVNDMLAKCRKISARGERQGSVVLKTEEVLEIRRLYRPGARFPDARSARSLAVIFGVSSGTISDVTRRSWRHIK